jgi:DNA mismatch endonuclease (patch repair protein)
VFRRAKVAVFVDGCFWHGCPEHGSQPKQNAAWWRTKLDANRARDEATNQELTEAGWLVMRFWAHEHPHAAATLVQGAVARRLP